MPCWFLPFTVIHSAVRCHGFPSTLRAATLAELPGECQLMLSASLAAMRQDVASVAVSPACEAEARSLCQDAIGTFEPEDGEPRRPFFNDQVFDCLNEHFDELSDVCQERVNDHSSSREDAIPDHFIEARYFELTQILTAVSFALLAVPLLVSAWAALLSRSLRVLIVEMQPYESSAASPAPTVVTPVPLLSAASSVCVALFPLLNGFAPSWHAWHQGLEKFGT